MFLNKSFCEIGFFLTLVAVSADAALTVHLTVDETNGTCFDQTGNYITAIWGGVVQGLPGPTGGNDLAYSFGPVVFAV